METHLFAIIISEQRVCVHCAASIEFIFPFHRML
jgi:hypothetical protein